MSDKLDESAVLVGEEHPLNPHHEEHDGAKSTSNPLEDDFDTKQTTKADDEPSEPHKEPISLKDQVHKDDISENKEEDNEEEDYTKPADPLQSSRLDNSAYSNINDDAWVQQQQENSLLDDEGRPNLAGSASPSIANTPVNERTVELDSDTSHVKGFRNAGDSSEIMDLEVSGQLPEWLIGEHYTIGPGTYDVRYMRKIEIDGHLQSATCTFSFGHWFDGLPLANRFDLNGKRNTITYRNRLTCRRLIEKVRDHHGYAPRHPAGLFKTDSNQTMLVKFIKSQPKTNKADGEPCGARILAGIPGIDGRLFAQNYANHIQELDPFDLKPTRVLCWDEVNPAFRGYSSCPNGQFDPRTGEYINFTMEIGYQSTRYHFFSISDRDPKGTVIASVTAPTGYVHSFSLTPRYIVLVIFPLLANSGAVKFAWNESIMDSFAFYPSEPTLFYVISREKGQHIVTYRSDPCFAFHHVNAFEDDNDSINVDIITYRDETIANQLTTENLRNPASMQPPRLAPSEVRRYVLTCIDEEAISFLTKNTLMPSTSGVTSRISSMWSYLRGSNASNDVERSDANSAQVSGWYASLPVASYRAIVQPSLELPQVNPLYKMQKYQYMYGLGFSAANSIADGKIWDSIVKTDMERKSVIASWHEENCYPSEAVFIPRPAEGDLELKEDDGVLVSVVLDSARAMSFLLILDASTMQVLAKADLGMIVPISFGRGSYRLRS